MTFMDMELEMWARRELGGSFALPEKKLTFCGLGLNLGGGGGGYTVCLSPCKTDGAYSDVKM
jgi:hypothetical protein